MKAAVLNQRDGRFDVEDIDISAPISREVSVDVRAAGLCHSDLHFARNDFGTPIPAVFGHEVAGVVSALGPDVSEFEVGDHVVGCILQWCGRCVPCRAGRTYQCRDRSVTLRDPAQGHRLTRRGEPIHAMFGTAGFAEATLIHENQLAKVPKDLPFPQAAILGCGTVTGVGAAINTAAVRPGDAIAVIGVGGVGLNVLSGARLAGATQLIAVDLHPAKLELAKRFGATDVIDASKTDPVEIVRALSGGGVHHAFEVVGTQRTALQALEMLADGGGAYLIGVQAPGSSITVDIMAGLISTQRKLQGVYFGNTNLKTDIPLYADLYLQGRLNLDDLISREIDLTEINEAYGDLEDGEIARAVIRF